MRGLAVPAPRRHRAGGTAGRKPARWVLAAVLSASLAVLAGCGVPTQSGPHALSASRIPQGLRNNPPPTTPPTKYEQPVQIYFTRTVNGTRYVAPVVPQKYVPPRATLKSVLEVLITTGPSTLDIGNGYQTELIHTEKVLGVTVKGNVATVDFNQAFGLISGTAGALAVAQVVYTVTQNQPTVTQVAFQIDGQPATVPSATGAEVPGTVTRADYATLLETSAPNTSTTAPSPATTPSTVVPPG